MCAPLALMALKLQVGLEKVGVLSIAAKLSFVLLSGEWFVILWRFMLMQPRPWAGRLDDGSLGHGRFVVLVLLLLLELIEYPEVVLIWRLLVNLLFYCRCRELARHHFPLAVDAAWRTYWPFQFSFFLNFLWIPLDIGDCHAFWSWTVSVVLAALSLADLFVF